VVIFCQICQARNLDVSRDEDWLLDLYLNPPVTPTCKVYMFNLTNPVGFFDNNERPVFNEVGPYAYKETWIRADQTWVSDGEVEFVPKKIYRFLPQLSSGNRQTDLVTSINVPMLALLHQMKYGPKVLERAANALLEVLNQKSLQTHVVREYMWGEKNDLVKLGRDIAYGKASRFPYEKFGLYIGKNDTDNGKLRVSSGMRAGGPPIGSVLSWRGKQVFDVWKPESQCDAVRGSDGLLFKPGLTKEETIYLFLPDFCRSFAMKFSQEVQQNGIKGYRFVMSKDTFSSPLEESNNQCFCVDGSCKGFGDVSGLTNMTACMHGAPLATSLPHFLHADESIRAKIIGMNPDPNLHESYVDIEPVTGVPLNVHFGIQVNAVMQPVQNVERAKGFRDITIPLIYTIVETNGLTETEHLNRLKSIIAKRRSNN